MTFRKSTRLNGSRIAIVLRSNANVIPDAVPGAPFVQFEKPQQPLRFFFYIKKLDILMSSFPVYLQYYLINDAADATKDCFIRNSVPIFNEIASNPVA